MVFNLCSSAGVHGVLVRLLFAGGGAMSEAMVASGTPRAGWPIVGGLDIVGDVGDMAAAGLLFLVGVVMDWWRKSGFIECG